MQPHFTFDSSMTPAAGSTRMTDGASLTSAEAVTFLDASAPTAGVSINQNSAMNLSGVYCATNTISMTTAGMPIQMCRRNDDGSRAVITNSKQHSLYKLIRRRPNPWTSWQSFRSTLQGHALNWGNGYAEIEWNTAGEVIALWQLTPNRVKPQLNKDDVPEYLIDGKSIIPWWKMLHIHGLGFDGLTGYPIIRMARESLSLAAAAEQFGAGFFGNAARPSGILSLKGRIPLEMRKQLRAEWQSMYQGKGTGRVAVLQDEGKFQAITMPPEEAQFLETRRFSNEEIARWYNLPVHMLHSMDRMTFSNVEQLDQNVLKYYLMPWLDAWTQEMNYKLIDDDEQEEFYLRVVTDAILRGDTLKRFQAYAIARQWGWLSVNDIRRLEDQDPIGPSGDVYLTPKNMGPAEMAKESEKVDKAEAVELMKAVGIVGPNGEPIEQYMAEERSNAA